MKCEKSQLSEWKMGRTPPTAAQSPHRLAVRTAKTEETPEGHRRGKYDFVIKQSKSASRDRGHLHPLPHGAILNKPFVLTLPSPFQFNRLMSFAIAVRISPKSFIGFHQSLWHLS